MASRYVWKDVNGKRVAELEDVPARRAPKAAPKKAAPKADKPEAQPEAKSE